MPPTAAALPPQAGRHSNYTIDACYASGPAPFQALEGAALLFGLLESKDVFRKFYVKHLAKRATTSGGGGGGGGGGGPAGVASDEAEEWLLAQLRAQCGHDYASKVAKMLADRQRAPATDAEFREWLAMRDGDGDGRDGGGGGGDDGGACWSRMAAMAGAAEEDGDEGGEAEAERGRRAVATAGSMTMAEREEAEEEAAAAAAGAHHASACRAVDFSVLVATAGSWPFALPAKAEAGFALPPPLQGCAGAFAAFYAEKHAKSRRLSWLPALSRAELRYRGCGGAGGRHYDLLVTTYQVALLLNFNGSRGDDDGALTAQELADACALPLAVVCRQLAPLLKHKLLLGAPASAAAAGTLEPGTPLSLNGSFESRRSRVKLSALPAPPGEAARESEATRREAAEDRKLAIQAAIVRILKSRRHCAHNTLLAEVITALHRVFVPQVSEIKRGIETLIDREYLVRDGGGYNYLA